MMFTPYVLPRTREIYSKNTEGLSLTTVTTKLTIYKQLISKQASKASLYLLDCPNKVTLPISKSGTLRDPGID